MKDFWIIKRVRDVYTDKKLEARKEKPNWSELKLGEERIHVVEKSAYDKAIETLKECSDYDLCGDKARLRDQLRHISIISTKVLRDLGELTTCKDCGVETKPGQGSARCPDCWDDKCGEG